jgi:hypothetical protein
MTPEELASRFPTAYHVAEAGSWPSIQRHGLLSTSALLDMYGYDGPARNAIERRHRPECVTIRHPLHGSASIRDQKPLNEIKLAACLTDGLTPGDWYLKLNERVFFWATHDRLRRLLKAKPYRDDVLFVDTRRLLERYGDNVTLSRINSGSTLMNPPKRGRTTFLGLQEYRHHDVAEIAVNGMVSNVEEITTRVLRMQGDAVLEPVWEPLG